MSVAPGPELAFESGTLVLRGFDAQTEALAALTQADARSACLRAPAHRYAQIVRAVHGRLEYADQARAYSILAQGPRVTRVARDYQQEALAAWLGASGQGVVVLPTGAGKSHLAVMAIAEKARSTLVVVPTLDLMHQWYQLLRSFFATDVGLIGGGDYVIHPLTITTYDSAYLHMENIGNRFGLVVFDECHHLPSESYALAARQCLAPFRLGLSATPERADGKEALLEDLIGPFVYSKEISELRGNFLSDYDLHTLEVQLSDEERDEYESERTIYTTFLRKHGIRMGSPRGFGEFIMRSSMTEEGQRAMAAYRRQKGLALAAPAKIELVEQLLLRHKDDRSLVFTQDNATAYAIGRRFLIPVITHQTKVSERADILSLLAEGEINAVATSKVLNEGVDVPSASTAIIVSGSGSVREHVQRLGRILRPQAGKRAQLYEILSAKTSESGTSERRREHNAYR